MLVSWGEAFSWLPLNLSIFQDTSHVFGSRAYHQNMERQSKRVSKSETEQETVLHAHVHTRLTTDF